MPRRKRLNKRVAFIGSGIFVLLTLLVIVALVRFGKNPKVFITDGDRAVAQADYALAKRHYLQALAVKDKALQIEVLFKLADVYSHLDQWPKVRGCWEAVLLRDPDSIKAALAILQSLYQRAHSQTRIGWQVADVWKDIGQKASALLSTAQQAGALNQNKSQWELPGMTEASVAQSLEHYLIFLQGRAAYEQAVLGAVTEPKDRLAQARIDFEKLVQENPTQVEAYLYLSKIAVASGDIAAAQGDLQAKDKASQQAQEILRQAVDAADTDPQSHLNLLQIQLEGLQRSPSDPTAAQLKQIEADYLVVTDRFSSSAPAFAALSTFYWMCCYYMGPELAEQNLDQAIQAAEKAAALDADNVDYMITWGQLSFRKASLFGYADSALEAMRIAERALALPAAQDGSGPHAWANKANRLSIFTFLANCSTECMLAARKKGELPHPEWLSQATEAVRQIGQIIGSEDDPEVIKWQGLLELAQGKRDLALAKLYTVYEKTKGSAKRGERDPLVAYSLARACKDAPEVGLALEAISVALEGGYGFTRPAAILDYLEILQRLDIWTPVISPVNPYSVYAYEKRFGPNQRSQALKIKALLHTNRMAEANTALDQLDGRAPATRQLRLHVLQSQIKHSQSVISQHMAQEKSVLGLDRQEPTSSASVSLMQEELLKYSIQAAQIVQTLIKEDKLPVAEQTVVRLCDTLLEQDSQSTAKELVDCYLAAKPDSAAIQFCRLLLREADPKQVSPEQRDALSQQAVAVIRDPIRKASEYGLFYRRTGQKTQAMASCQEALNSAASDGYTLPEGADEGRNPVQIAGDSLLELAIQEQDWDLAQTVLERARPMNLDQCQGEFWAARLAFARGQFAEALQKMNAGLELRPVFSQGYMLRSLIHTALDKEAEALADVLKAASFNPLDPRIAKVHAINLETRNNTLGQSVTALQLTEAKEALERAIQLNPLDTTLLGLYAGKISSDEPFKALAIYQSIQQRFPTLQNTLALGSLAQTVAAQQADATRAQALYDIARQAFETAYAMEPGNRRMLQAYAQYFRATGQQDRAEQLLQEAQDPTLLWRHFVGQGKPEQARQVLDKLYEGNPKDVDVLRGLLVIAEMTEDAAGLQRYFNELIAVEDSLGNRFDQIVIYLKMGFLSEAQSALGRMQTKYADDPKVILLQAWVAMRKGQFVEALAQINRALAQDTEDAMMWYIKGQINSLMTHYPDAIVSFRRSKGLAADNVAACVALGRAYILAGRPREGIAELEALVEKPRAPFGAKRLLEQALMQQDNTRTLSRFYNTMMAQSPDDVRWYLQAGVFEETQGRSESALELLGQALDIKQASYAGQMSGAWAKDSLYATILDTYLETMHKSAGEPGTATWRSDKLAALQQEAQTYIDGPFGFVAAYRMAQAKLTLGDDAEAVQLCRLALDKAGADYETLSGMVLRVNDLLGADAVLDYCSDLHAEQPESITSDFVRYALDQELNGFDRALESLNKCISSVSADSLERIAFVQRRAHLLTIAYEKTLDRSRLQKAIADYESLVEKMPNNTGVLNNLAYVLALNDIRLSDALSLAQKALELSPNNPTMMDTYGFVLYKNRDYEKALEYLSAARQQFEQMEAGVPSEIHEHIAMVKEMLGLKNEAKKAYQQALDADTGKLPAAVAERIRDNIGRLSE